MLLTGDQAHFRENYEANGVPTFNFNRADTLASFDRFKQIAKNLNATVIIQHDPRDIDKLPAFPAAAKYAPDRDSQPADLAPILQLLRTQLAGARHRAHDAGARACDAGLIEDHSLGRILTARSDGELVGVAVISFLWTLEHGGPAAWLDEVYVEPARRGDGIGRQARGGGDAGRARQRLHRARSRSRCRVMKRPNGFTSAWDSGGTGACAGCACWIVK